MPFARVGAMPQPASQPRQRHAHSAGGAESSGRQKGITMEDLKKQTALRLAQEQQQHHGRHSNPNIEPKEVGQPLRQPPDQSANLFSCPSYQQAPDPYPDPGYETPMSQQPPSHHQGYEYQAVTHQSSNSMHLLNTYENSSCVSDPLGQGYDQAMGHKRPKPRNQRKPHHQAPQPQLNAHGGPASPNSRYMQDQRAWYPRPAPPPTIAATPPPVDVDASSQSAGSAGKSKLPHGLTVHELKEMTKARLQAEAVERHDDHVGSFDQKRVSPLDFDQSGSESRERAMSRDSTGLNQGRLHRGQTSDSMSSIPSMVQVNPTNRDIPQMGRQPQVSPLPPGFQNFGPPNPSLSAFLDSAEAQGRSGLEYLARIPNTACDNLQHHPKGEAWESASVTSHNSTVVSEYLGSESALSTGASGRMPQPSEEMGGIHFNRVRSYTANAALGIPYEMPSPTSDGFSRGGIFFDAAVGGPNRLRSYTLSPQPGLIHEDRPHFSGETLGIPSFSSCGRRASLSRSRHNYSPVMPHMSSESLRFGYSAGFGDGSNRPRTSSTTSLPPMSHTAEEFALDRPIQSSRFSASQPFLRTGPISEEGLPGLAVGVFDYPYVSSGREGPADFAGSGSVFRDVPISNNLPPPPPGMFGNKGQISSGSTSSLTVNFSRVGSMDSVAEARVSSTWDGSGGDLLGSRAGSIDEMLSNDLGSILKLSGATDRHDRDQSNSLHTSNSGGVRPPFKESFHGMEHHSFH